jgi:hypothetical protein
VAEEGAENKLRALRAETGGEKTALGLASAR